MQRLEKGCFCGLGRSGREPFWEVAVKHPARERTGRESAGVSFNQKRAAEMRKCRTATVVALREYDVIVVGSGAAGGIACHVLANHGLKVLCLDAGKVIDLFHLQTPQLGVRALQHRCVPSNSLEDGAGVGMVRRTGTANPPGRDLRSLDRSVGDSEGRRLTWCRWDSIYL